MASETVDPIDRSHPLPYTGQYPLSSTYCAVQCRLQITDLLLSARRGRATFGMPGQLTACAATQGMLYKIRCNPTHPLIGVLPGPYVPVRVHAVLWSHIGTLMRRLAAEPRSTTGLLFPFQCPSGTILLTPYSMVRDWQVSRAGPMLFNWPKLLYPYYSLLFFFPLSSFCL